MDAWCALWFWPIDQASLLPSRTRFLQDLDLVLTQGVTGQTVQIEAFSTGSPQGRLFKSVLVPAEKGAGVLFGMEERAVDLWRGDLFGDADVEKLITASPWLPSAMHVALQRRFMHFDLEFADVMRERCGFDLVIGNPPWTKTAWSDPLMLGERIPEIAIRGHSASKVEEDKRGYFGADATLASWYLENYAAVGGLQASISAPQNYPYVESGNPNLYQCFIDLSFRVVSGKGIVALIHQDSHFMEPKLKYFRDECFSRLVKHYHFRNEIYQKMFTEVNHSEVFSLNVYRGETGSVNFEHVSGLFLPSTIDECYEHDGVGEVPGIRRGDTWDTRGHKHRIIAIDRPALSMMAMMTSEEGQGSGRFVYAHSSESFGVLKKLASEAQIASSLRGRYVMSSMWHEGQATKQKRLIRIGGDFMPSADDLIIKSPCIYVGNPFYKTPDQSCKAKEDFEPIDLNRISDSYTARSNFSRIVTKSALYLSSPSVPWSARLKHSDHYRIAFRGMVQPARERTLAAAVICPGIQHVDGLESMSFENEDDLISIYPLTISLVYDFLVKSMQVEKIRDSVVKYLPFARISDTAKSRALRLCCLTEGYADIWNRNHISLQVEPWSVNDNRLTHDAPNVGMGMWSRAVGLKSDFARRLALVEIDVLVSQAFRMSIEELLQIYRTQFPVLSENESGTWYDSLGQIVWTCNKGLTEIGWRKNDGRKPTRKEWMASYANLGVGSVLECELRTNFRPGGPHRDVRKFHAPFSLCDREADYRRAWAFFASDEHRKAT